MPTERMRILNLSLFKRKEQEFYKIAEYGFTRYTLILTVCPFVLLSVFYCIAYLIFLLVISTNIKIVRYLIWYSLICLFTSINDLL